MSAIASVVDGKIVNQTTAEQKAEEAKTHSILQKV